jgi:transporter family protein
MNPFPGWVGFALGSAFFAALTALFGKLGVAGINSNMATLCYYRALQLGPVSKVAPIDKLSVAIAILLGVLVLGEQLTWQVALGGALIVAGSLVIILL